jgi:hypothetical protein
VHSRYKLTLGIATTVHQFGQSSPDHQIAQMYVRNNFSPFDKGRQSSGSGLFCQSHPWGGCGGHQSRRALVGHPSFDQLGGTGPYGETQQNKHNHMGPGKRNIWNHLRMACQSSLSCQSRRHRRRVSFGEPEERWYKKKTTSGIVRFSTNYSTIVEVKQILNNGARRYYFVHSYIAINIYTTYGYSYWDSYWGMHTRHRAK